MTAAALTQRTLFSVPGLHCAGCISKLERGLADAPGIAAARVNFTSRQVSVEHAPEIELPELQAAIARAGFEAQPISAAAAKTTSETKALVRATGVAGFASMNVMMLSVAVWSGADGATRDLFHAVSALIAIPTVAYSGEPTWTCRSRSASFSSPRSACSRP